MENENNSLHSWQDHYAWGTYLAKKTATRSEQQNREGFPQAAKFYLPPISMQLHPKKKKSASIPNNPTKLQLSWPT